MPKPEHFSEEQLKNLSEDKLAVHVIQSIRTEDIAALKMIEKANIDSGLVLKNTLEKYPEVRKAVYNKTLLVGIDDSGKGFNTGHVFIGHENDQGVMEVHGFYPRDKSLVFGKGIVVDKTKGYDIDKKEEIEPRVAVIDGKVASKYNTINAFIPIPEERLKQTNIYIAD